MQAPEEAAPFTEDKKQDLSAGLKKPGRYAKLPSYGYAYMDQLIGEFRSLKDVCEDEKAKAFAQEIVAQAERGAQMTWGDAYMLDTAIAQMLPKEYLHQRAWCLEVKYRDAVGMPTHTKLS